MKIYSEKYLVKSYETDMNASLKLFTFMNYAQEIAGQHANLLGFGYDTLIKEGFVWVLSRMHIIFKDIPKWKDNITMYTWHKGGDRLFWYRDFVVNNEDEEAVIKATSSWVIINIETRKMHKIELLGHPDTIHLKDAITEHAEKIITPHEMEYVHTKKVSYSDVDINKHTNNAKYVEWAIDSLDPEFYSSIQVSDMIINFNLETRLNDQVEIYRHISNNNVIIEGKKEKNSIFTIKMIIK
ncbi:MAG: acyl-ACP thioesterase domain-containing protein [Rikenellaceae bacterium]|jgi:acyl-ACP thioesterase